MRGIFLSLQSYIVAGGMALKNIMLVSYSFIAALIGAGFASGQEILCYFAIFGKNGVWGICTAAALFMFFIYSVLSTCATLELYSFDTFLNIIGNKHIRKTIRVISITFLFAVFAAMLSAFGEIFTVFGIAPRIGALITSAVCALILSSGSRPVFDVNGALGLILTAAIITCCAYMLRYREYHAFAEIRPVVVNAGIYSGYNLLSAVPLLSVMSRRIESRADAAAAAIISSLAAGLMLLMIFLIIATYAGKIPLGELPMLTLAARQNPTFAMIYRIILLLASSTTLIASGGSILEAVPARKSFFTAAALCMLGYFLSGWGFSGLVNKAYRMSGAVGIIICGYLCFICLKKQRFSALYRANQRI